MVSKKVIYLNPFLLNNNSQISLAIYLNGGENFKHLFQNLLWFFPSFLLTAQNNFKKATNIGYRFVF